MSSANIEFIGSQVRTDESFILSHPNETPSESSIIYLSKPPTFNDSSIQLFNLQDDSAFVSEHDETHQQYQSQQHLQHHRQPHTPQQSLVLIVDEDGLSPAVENKELSNAQNNDEDSRNLDNEASCSSNSSDNSATSSSAPTSLIIKSAAPSMSIVPALSNVEDIFNILSRKIAKYCQILSDLTNCEVFYKAQLPVNPVNHKEPKTQPSKYKPKNVVNKNIRSLYWGTNKMLFEHSHGQGLRYQKFNGDSLIKIGCRSLNGDLSSLIEELLKEPNQAGFNTTNSNYKTQTRKLLSKQQPTSETTSHTNSGKSLIKECSVALDRLDDDTFEYYLKKFEAYNNNPNPYQTMMDFDLLVEECTQEEELYSNEAKYKIQKKTKRGSKLTGEVSEIEIGRKRKVMHEGEEHEFIYHDGDEDDLLEDLNDRTCYSLDNRLESIENEEELYSCEYCDDHYYKHLTQLRLHHLTCHDQVQISQSAPFTCEKCGNPEFEDRVEYLKHLLVCYYPDIYTCKSCDTSYSSYPQYYFHLKYVHIPVVYMCAICSRKYRNIKDLIEHDQLMHSKTINSCELCGLTLKTRPELHEHYAKSHLQVDGGKASRNSEETNLIIKPASSIVERKESVETSQKILVDEMITKSDIPTASAIVQRGTSTDEIIMDDDDDEEETVNEKAALSRPPESTVMVVRDSSNSDTDDEDEDDEGEWPKVHKNDLIRGLIDRKHQCKWCSLRFYSKSQLKQHEATHTNSVLTCPVCDKQFTQKDRLSGHMKCHMEPSLECKVCGKKFKRLCNLYNHELVHGLTEHAFMLCQFCGRGFRSRRDYQNHVIANHRELLMKSENSTENEQSVTRGSKIKSKKSKTSHSDVTAQSSQSSVCYQTQRGAVETTTSNTHTSNLDDYIF